MSNLFDCNNACLCDLENLQRLDYSNCTDITHVVESPVHIFFIAKAATLTSLSLDELLHLIIFFLFLAINLARESL